MRDLFRESTFGRLVQFLSRGKLFLAEEQLDPSSVEKYIQTKPPSSSRSSFFEDDAPSDNAASDAEKFEPEKADPEMGKDFQLVD
jgi:hypothetical protein